MSNKPGEQKKVHRPSVKSVSTQKPPTRDAATRRDTNAWFEGTVNRKLLQDYVTLECARKDD